MHDAENDKFAIDTIRQYERTHNIDGSSVR